MAPVASDVYNRARAVLNDVGASLYTNSELLPYIKIAMDELSDELVLNGVPLQNEEDVDLTVTAGDTELQDLPSDIIVPLTLYERPATSTDDGDYVQMEERAWDKNAEPGESLVYWLWQNQAIKFLGATTDRVVRLDYIRELVPITVDGSSTQKQGSLNYLAYKTAELAARNVGMNDIIANNIRADAERHLRRLIRIAVRKNQSLRTRRKGFRLTSFRRSIL